MRAGGGKAKGASFEREICRRLSLWVSHGKREDLFWRSAMSGGRATVAGRRGVTLAAQAGDISSVDKEGHVLTETLYFETKHVKDIGVEAFVIKNTGPLAKYWRTAVREAKQYGKEPVLIIRQNRLPTLWISQPNTIRGLFASRPKRRELAVVYFPNGRCSIWLLDTVLGTQFNR
jgi:hypothetical protein